MTFANKTVVITGGTGALGTAVVSALIAQGARCVVPYVHAAEMQRFAHRGDKTVTLVAVQNLADEADVTKLYAQAGAPLWGSIHIAGGFAMGKVADTDKALMPARAALEPRTGAGMSAYTIAKSGVAALTMALAEEVAKDGILVNAVAPSIMDTAANRASMPKADFAAWPKVEEVAATILHLASPDNRVTRGAIVPVYGKS
jgi:NAD(P)-dependent dehydrogenase (short-subunit alcohol dehydrogenase family)